MGTTSDKLTYLNETKTLLKSKINLTGANITTDTFRQYPTKLQNALLDVWNNEGEPIFTNWGTKVNGEGTNVKLDNTINARMKITPKGNTSQISYTGSNLLNINGQLNVENLTYPTSISNGRISIPTASSGTGNAVSALLDWIPVEEGETYKPNYKVIQGNVRYGFRLYDSSKNLINDSSISISGYLYLAGYYGYYYDDNRSFTIPSGNGIAYIRLMTFAKASDVSPIILDEAQVNIGTSVLPYEPFVGGSPSPSPSFPQIIHSVSGDNEIEICGENLFDKNSPYIVNGYLNANGSITTNASYRVSNYMYIGNFSKITIAGNIENSLVYCFYDENKNLLGANGITGSSKTITPPTNTKYIRTTISASGLDSYMVVEGETAPSEYIPYTGDTYPIYLGVENLYDITKFIQGTWNSSTVNNRVVGFLKQVKSGESYTLSLKNNNYEYAIGNSTTNTQSGNTAIQSDSGWQSGEKYTYNITGNGYLWVQVRKANGNNITPSELLATDFDLVIGTKPQRTSTQPITLNKIGTYQDYIYKTDKWYLHKEVGKVVLNGSESWSYEGGRFVVNFLINALNTSGRQQALSDYFNYVASGSASYGIFIYKASDTNYQIYVYDNDYSTASDFKTWLSTHNTNVYYILGTPTDNEITDTNLINQLESLKGAMSYEGQTNISSGFMIVGVSALGELE